MHSIIAIIIIIIIIIYSIISLGWSDGMKGRSSGGDGGGDVIVEVELVAVVIEVDDWRRRGGASRAPWDSPAGVALQGRNQYLPVGAEDLPATPPTHP